MHETMLMSKQYFWCFMNMVLSVCDDSFAVSLTVSLSLILSSSPPVFLSFCSEATHAHCWSIFCLRLILGFVSTRMIPPSPYSVFTFIRGVHISATNRLSLAPSRSGDGAAIGRLALWHSIRLALQDLMTMVLTSFVWGFKWEYRNLRHWTLPRCRSSMRRLSSPFCSGWEQEYEIIHLGTLTLEISFSILKLYTGYDFEFSLTWLLYCNYNLERLASPYQNLFTTCQYEFIMQSWNNILIWYGGICWH